MTRIDVDGDRASDGLLSLVIAVVEVVVEALEREAVRRMESGALSDEEIERLGTQLAALEEELEHLKTSQDLEQPVDDLRRDLDGLVGDFLDRVDDGGWEAVGDE
ncbi:gas vesicle protein GvpK [Halomarina ordinaria]|uniref:Gas vesicle protein GvpK n=1 Tax=Halomarina ordinaria TaxID=3033939 RepID=A0ABD5U4H9_9EURY|nr:gas vesicle protein GvpK [Halomarina sp. PSRA2]